MEPPADTLEAPEPDAEPARQCRQDGRPSSTALQSDEIRVGAAQTSRGVLLNDTARHGGELRAGQGALASAA
ncbi:hypothetical protein [Streptomyces sp. NPDC047141]|uniref:hypothetical protein n=1 Tax=Streptomyces sp. NPDC047141 TaxID=3155738 RepID=UPI003401FF6A